MWSQERFSFKPCGLKLQTTPVLFHVPTNRSNVFVVYIRKGAAFKMDVSLQFKTHQSASQPCAMRHCLHFAFKKT
jgi:hypothetical protein